MGLQPLDIYLLLQCMDRLQSSESDVYGRQIMTTNVDPRTVRVKQVDLHNNKQEKAVAMSEKLITLDLSRLL